MRKKTDYDTQNVSKNEVPDISNDNETPNTSSEELKDSEQGGTNNINK